MVMIIQTTVTVGDIDFTLCHKEQVLRGAIGAQRVNRYNWQTNKRVSGGRCSSINRINPSQNHSLIRGREMVPPRRRDFISARLSNCRITWRWEPSLTQMRLNFWIRLGFPFVALLCVWLYFSNVVIGSATILWTLMPVCWLVGLVFFWLDVLYS